MIRLTCLIRQIFNSLPKPPMICIPQKTFTNVRNSNDGFSLIEVVVGSALFLIVAMAAYGAYTSLFQVAQLNQSKILAIALADEQFEIIRNMPYVNVGLTTGIPQGTLQRTQTITRGNIPFTVTLTIRNVDLATSTFQASSRLVEVKVSCDTCKSFTPIALTGQVAPANLQSASAGGALVVQVLDSAGNPVSGATVNVVSTATSSIQNTDVTNNSGLLNIVGVPQGINVYHISVTKAGYSSDQTLPITIQNPTPDKPDATVVNQQASQVTLTIDKISSLHVTSVSPTCQLVPSFDFNMTGSRQRGSGVPNYNQNLLTDSSGILDLNTLTWDTYSISPIDASYDLSGITPLSPLTLNPGNAQNLQLVVVPKQTNALMVSVVDNTTQLPLSSTTVRLTGSGSNSGVDRTLVTGQGFMNQVDWSSGAGQTTFTNPSAYFADDGNVDVSVAGNIALKKVFGTYNPSASLQSSTFDTGSLSNFYTLSWKPTNQPILTGINSLRFQLASNATITPTSTWSYIGPSGSASDYYTVTGSPVASIHNNKRYLRYKTYLQTAVSTTTPVVSNVSVTYTSSCTPPGQVLFSGLSNGTYTLTVSRSGYTSWSGTVTINSAWQNKVVQLGV